MISLHIEGATAGAFIADLIRLTAALGPGSGVQAVAVSEPQVNTGAQQEEKPAARKARATREEKKEEPVKYDPPANDAPAETQALSVLLPKLTAKIGRDKVIALLKDFNATRLREVAEKDIPEFTKKVNDLLAA